MRRIRRAVIASVIALLSGAVGLVPGIAQAEEGTVRALGAWTTADASGDVPICQGDIYRVSTIYNDDQFLLSTTVNCASNPDSDPSWVVGATYAYWGLDTTGDGVVDYGIDMYNTGTGRAADVGSWNGSGWDFLCSATPTWDGDKTFGAIVPSGCIGAPAATSVVHGFLWDENPYGDDCLCREDRAPDNGWSPAINKGGVRQGYWMIGRTGDTYSFGDAAHYGNTPSANVVDIEPTPTGLGYSTVNAGGLVHVFGDARYFGSAGGLTAGETVTSLSRTADGGGYWIFTTLGRVLTFGNAKHFGDMSGVKLNGPVLDSIPTPSGQGYYMVASDGGIFAFGDALFWGSMGGTPLNAPVQSLVPDADGRGYWLVASDGGIFAFEALFYGSMGSTRLNKPVTGMVGFGNGYMMVAEDGGIFSFGEAPFKGSLGANPPAQPIVSVATLNL